MRDKCRTVVLAVARRGALLTQSTPRLTAVPESYFGVPSGSLAAIGPGSGDDLEYLRACARVGVVNLVKSVAAAAAAAAIVALSGCSSDDSAEVGQFDSVDYALTDTPGSDASSPAAEEMAEGQVADGSDLRVDVIRFDAESFKALPSLVIQNDAGEQWVIVVDATAIVQRGDVRCAVVFYHYPSVRSDPWQPPPTGLDVDGQRIESTSACDGLVLDAGLPHPALDFAGNNAVIVFEGFPVSTGASIEAFVVDGDSYDIWQ